MKNMMKSLAVVAAVLSLTATAYAGECCIKAAKASKDGKTCELPREGRLLQEGSKGRRQRREGVREMRREGKEVNLPVLWRGRTSIRCVDSVSHFREPPDQTTSPMKSAATEQPPPEVSSETSARAAHWLADHGDALYRVALGRTRNPDVAAIWFRKRCSQG